MACKATIKRYKALEASAQRRLEMARKQVRDMTAEWRAAQGPAARFAVENRLYFAYGELAEAGRAFEAARDAYLALVPSGSGYATNPEDPTP